MNFHKTNHNDIIKTIKYKISDIISFTNWQIQISDIILHGPAWDIPKVNKNKKKRKKIVYVLFSYNR